MNDLSAIGVGLRRVVVAAALALCAAPALAAPAGGPGSLSGIWNNLGVPTLQPGPPRDGAPSVRIVGGQAVPLLPDAAKAVVETLGGPPAGADSGMCLTEGMPGVMSPPPQYAIQVVEAPDQVTVLMEDLRVYRIIRMNTDHPEDPDPSFMGDSVGRWEGDTLVVDTVALTDMTSILGAIPHSDRLHIVERIRRTGADAMENQITIEDSETFSTSWTLVVRYRKSSAVQLAGVNCFERSKAAR